MIQLKRTRLHLVLNDERISARDLSTGCTINTDVIKIALR